MSVDTHMNISPVLGKGMAETLTGTGRSEVISGAGGNDKLFGLSGNDELFGGTGDDIVYGQGGHDTLYGNGRPSYVDLNQLVMSESVEATVTFVDEGAGFRNALGVYEIDPTGHFNNVKILFPNASKTGSGGSLTPGESQVKFDVAEGAQLGFFVISNGYGKGYLNRAALDDPNGYFELRNGENEVGQLDGGPVHLWHINRETGEEYQVKSQYGYEIFHSAATAADNYAINPDNYLHVVGRANAVSGDLLIGFEDLYGGGDNDYDDTVININLGQQNIVSQLPQSSGVGGPFSDDDQLYGGDGNDVIYGIGGDDYITGGDGHDELNGNSGHDEIWGNQGDDKLNGQSGSDLLYGGSGSDELVGGSGDDILHGGGGDDDLTGGSGVDMLFGDSGDDILSGSSGNDIIFGGNGKDTLNGNSGNDILEGGGGNDNLNGHSGDDQLSGGSGQDRLVGGGGDDFLSGGDHNDKVYGGSGLDELHGNDGNDYLSAGSGDDVIVGGAGGDKMFGGSGSDTFVLSEMHSGDHDIIADFKTGDVVDWSWMELSSHDELMSQASQQGNHTVFDFGDYSVRFNNVELESIEVDDFVL